MDTPVFLLLVVLTTTLVQVHCSGTCSSQYPVIPGPPGPPGPPGRDGQDGRDGRDGHNGRDGRDGINGIPTHTGGKCDQGDICSNGSPGSNNFTNGDLNCICDNITAELLDIIQKLNQTLTDRLLYLESQVPVTVCNITSANWRRVAYFDTTQGNSCPTGLRTVTNTTTSQTACGRINNNAGCTSVLIPVQSNYSQVCGIVKGYQEGSPDAFEPVYQGYNTIDTYYVDGVSITHGSPRRHLWTYATGVTETQGGEQYRCPCARSNPNDRTYVPTFVGEHFYCESGYSGSRVAWEDPLWDGQNCAAPGNKCCERYGWFHRDVSSSTDDIELRICAQNGISNEDTLISHYEFWVM